MLLALIHCVKTERAGEGAAAAGRKQAGQAGRAAGSVVRGLWLISGRCLYMLLLQSLAPLLSPLKQHRHSGELLLAVTPSGPLLWPWASPAGGELPASTSTLPHERHGQTAAMGTR